MPFFRGTFFGNYGIMNMQFQSGGNVHVIMGINFETEEIMDHHLYELERMR